MKFDMVRVTAVTIALISALAWVACTRKGEREPVVGVTSLSELAQDEAAVLPDGGNAYADAGADGADAADGGEDLSYDEKFAEDGGSDDE